MQAYRLATHERMVSSNRHRQLACSRMGTNDVCYRLVDLGDQARILQSADRRVIQRRYFLELVMSIELHVPSQSFELLDQPGIDEVDWALVNACVALYEC